MGIIDRREIEFDAKALVSVIGGSPQRAEAIGLRALRPAGVDFSTEGQIRFLYEAYPEIRVTAEALGVLLVSYCVRSRIPIPRLADKVVRVRGNSVVLSFNTQLADAPAKW